MIKAIVFDLDGTLLDSLNTWQKVDDLFLERRNIPVPEDYQEAMLTMHFTEAADYTIKRFGLNEQPEAIVDEWMDSAKLMYEHEVELKPGVKEMLFSLKEKGYRLAIVTSCDRALYRPCLKRHGILDLFETVVEANTLNMSKSKPEIYHYLLNQLQLKGEECYFIDDVYHALSAAKSLGFHVVGVYDQRSYDKKMEEVTSIILRDFKKAGN